ncbi:hypothetical protein I4U23_002441 [Adineta vaga]|nr:hypothetical protein I4U23_002441 [Adineta vaga]
MTTSKVQAILNVKSEQFHQILEESVLDSSTKDSSSSYEGLIAANQRLKSNISKILTEFVNKARLEQNANGDQKKRKLEHDDDNGDDEENQDEQEDDDDDDDAELSDNGEDEHK